MPMEKVTVMAPASIANVGPGFDVFGLALKEPFDLVTAEKRKDKGVRVRKVEWATGRPVTLDPKRNTAAVAAARVLETAGADFGVDLVIRKGVRPCSGMGSSGASAAGGAYAVNLLLQEPLSDIQLIACAACGEEASSGSFHADNVAPSLLGGFTIVRSYEPLDVIRVKPPSSLGIVAALPDVQVPTKEAREKVPQSVPLKSMVFQVGHASALAVGMAMRDMELIARSLRDKVVEPARAPLVPYLKEAEEAALRAGAKASFLGGSGPCVASFFDREEVNGEAIARAVREVYLQKGIGCSTWVTTWGRGSRRWRN
ncbi:MAG: homoserine kinase [Methanomassiliicoccales archaeon]